ncbi:LOW QUALITY PROTEIN: zinc finger protein 280D [Sceloporus undulatus]|uniref:LOW QUALITY PROTEIN: zinc finger protein 280D n=1 Tax=Sceloporus undulatus TaxID=8520 RepID=UPI001C4C35FE|nr:LOW QUALITY PROTEIN: zinc finger protein 280D [Sceloporus undulatus]
MAELFMECEEEELEPWQQKAKPIVVDDDDDDDEPIFVGEIVSSKPTSSYILNRVNPSSSRMGMQNGAARRGFHSATTRPATTTLAVQPQPRVSSAPGTSPVLQRSLSGCSAPQETAKSSPGLTQPISRSPTAPSLSRNLSLPGLAQSASRPVATVTAQPVTLSRVTPNNTSGVAFALRPNSGVPQCQSGSTVITAGLSKRPSTSEADGITPKKPKANEMGLGSDSSGLPSIQSPSDSLLQKGVTSSNIKNGAPFPQACPKCNIHFNLLEPLKNHIKYCCPDMMHTFLGATNTDYSAASAKTAESESGKLIMLVNDFYYGKHEGNVQQVRQEQKTHTTFKCASCMKLLKSNIRFMNHMKHHLELEKQNSESWESHTTCQHCYRQFPTPFQLQCHIESTHTPHESSTICKICELSFETEQVLLQHMKDNHKPGEMPYVCQVCNYRSSTFSDVEKHFRAVHENTKNLLCPFCLKVIKIGAPYMHHFMRHQKKGVHRCTKCRLQFLTCKEKTDHKSQHHRTFKKPVQLEGLPPGTKVTIRASAGSLQPVSTTASPVSASPVSANVSTLQLSPGAKVANTKSNSRLNANKAKTKLKPLNIQKKQSLCTSNSSTSSISSLNSSSGNSNKKNNKIANTALNHLRCPDIQKCIECNSDIRTFASHFPAYVHCSLCRYSTSCSKAYVNHMMSFHSDRQSKRFWIYKTHSDELRGMTVVCLNCDFLADVSDLDKMAAHLNDNQTHTCQVIVENVPMDHLAAENPLGLLDKTLLDNESEEKSQKLPGPSTPEEEKETSLSESSQIKDVPEDAIKDHFGNQHEDAALVAKCEEENKAPVLANSFGPELPDSSNVPREGEKTESPRNQSEEGCAAIEGQETESPPLKSMSTPWLHACAKDSAEEGNGGPSGSQTDESLLAAEGEETVPASTAEDGSHLEFQACSQYSARDGNTEVLAGPGDEDPAATASEDSTRLPVLEKHSNSGPSASSEDPMDTAEGGDPDCLSSQEGEKHTLPSALQNENSSRPSACSPDSTDAAELGDANCLSSEGNSSLVMECEGSALPLVLEKSPLSGPTVCADEPVDAAEEDSEDQEKRGSGGLAPASEEGPLSSILEAPSSTAPSTCSEDPIDVAGGGGDDTKGCLPADRDGSQAAESEESPLPSTSETEASSVPTFCSNESIDPSQEAKRDRLGSEAGEEAPSAAHHKDSASVSSGEEFCISDGHACPTGSPKDATRDHLGHKSDGGEETVSVGSPEESTPSLEPQACPEASSHEKAVPEEPSQPGGGPDTGSHQHSEAAVVAVQAQADDSDEAEQADMNLNSEELASDKDVSFEQFLRRRGEPDSATSDVSEQGSVHLEPLTPSEVLEHEATEILQKGGVASSAKASLEGSEQGDAPSSDPGSPSPEEALLDPADRSEEAS